MFIHFRSFICPFILLSSLGGSVALPNPRGVRDAHAFFVPELVSQTFNGGLALNLTNLDRSDVFLRAVQGFLQDKTSSNWVPTWGSASMSTSDGQVFSFHQTISGLPVLNMIGRVWVQDSRVTSFQAPAISNVTASKASKVVPEAAIYDAIATQLGVQAHSGAKLLSDYFFLTGPQTATQVWAVPLPSDANAWLAYVDATTGSVVGVQPTLPLPNLGNEPHPVPRIRARSPALVTKTVIVTVPPKPTKTVVVTVTATGPPPVLTLTRPVVTVVVTVTATGPAPQPSPQCPFWFPTCVDDFA